MLLFIKTKSMHIFRNRVKVSINAALLVPPSTPCVLTHMIGFLYPYKIPQNVKYGGTSAMSLKIVQDSAIQMQWYAVRCIAVQ